jgi:hypothetical protein
MSAGAFSRDERHALVARITHLFKLVFEPPPEDTADAHEHGKRKEALFAALAEYGDRLPRVRMSTCPHTGAPYIRAFDPFGLDGPWWHKLKIFDISDPDPPETFRVILGALDLHGRAPAEATEEIIPGPAAPFVVPRLLELPGMVAVVNRLEMDTGDVAYPVAYFANEPTPPEQLHQFWLRQDFWFENAGGSSWLIANDVWDFELEPWLASGRLKWIRPGDPSGTVIGSGSGETCPCLALSGERAPQVIEAGERDVVDLPDGEPVNPFDEP